MNLSSLLRWATLLAGALAPACDAPPGDALGAMGGSLASSSGASGGSAIPTANGGVAGAGTPPSMSSTGSSGAGLGGNGMVGAAGLSATLGGSGGASAGSGGMGLGGAPPRSGSAGVTVGGETSQPTGGAESSGAGGDGAGGSAGDGVTPNAGTGGAPPVCVEREGTDTRPQLTSDEAESYTIVSYFSSGPDAWDPTPGLGDASDFTPDFTVAADGSGTHTSVQAALADADGSERQYILVQPGTYREVVSISGSTPITLYGAGPDADDVVIVNGRSAGDAGGTGNSATFTSRAPGLELLNLSVSNDFATPMSGSNIQAVALYTTGDKTVLENVKLHGFQDTLYVDSSSATDVARVYIKNSFIEGDTDFIFGRAVLVVHGGTIHYLSSRKGNGGGVIFAPSTHVDNDYGFLATRVDFTADENAPTSKIALARSWDQSSTVPTPNGQAIVRESTLGAHISLTAPWTSAATSGRAYSVTGNRFNEYCNSGPGAGP